MPTRLSHKQKRFIDFYKGNATEAALEAGYSAKSAYSIGQENLKKPEILKEIQNRNVREAMPKIANRQQRQEFWSSIMNDAEVDLSIRLRASELLGKSEADFTEKVIGNVNIDFAKRLQDARERVKAYQASQNTVEKRV